MFKLELRIYGNSSTLEENFRICFENLIAIATHREEILKKAIDLGGNIANQSLIYFTNSKNLLELVKFIADL